MARQRQHLQIRLCKEKRFGKISKMPERQIPQKVWHQNTRKTTRKAKIEKAVKLLNSRPRKRLNYLTPYEVFNGKTECCALE